MPSRNATTSPSSRRSSPGRPCSSGKDDGDVVLVAGGEPQPAVAYVDQHPHAVPLHLVHPLRRPSARGCRGWRAWDAWVHPVGYWSTSRSRSDQRRYEHACDLEGGGLVRTRQRPGEALLGDRVPRRLVPAGARQGRRADQVPAGLLDRRRGGRLRRHRQGLRDRGRRDGHPHRRRHGRAAVDVLARDRGREVRAERPDRPDALREVLLPRAGEAPAPSPTPCSARRCSTPTGWRS